jgi:hypothetical protein
MRRSAELSRAHLIRSAVADLYRRHSVEYIARELEVHVRIVRAAIILCIRERLIEGPFSDRGEENGDLVPSGGSEVRNSQVREASEKDKAIHLPTQAAGKEGGE